MSSTPAGTPPTIYDVARLAGVAPSTVSRTFARPGRVNAATAARIRQVADEIGYRSGPVVGPSGRSTRMIALTVPDLANPFTADLARGVQQAAREAGYVVVHGDAQESGAWERDLLEHLLPAVEGIIVGSTRLPDSALHTIAKQRPLVTLNRELRGVPSVLMDNPAGIRAAVKHLASLGHEAITYVAGPEASWTDGVRWRALRNASQDAGLASHRIGPFPPTFEGGLSAAAQLLDELPTAVIAFNDLVAIGVIHGVRLGGALVPHDLSVVGHDNIQMSRLVTPALTTVAGPQRFMGALAVRYLLAMTRDPGASDGHPVMMPVKLTVRGSTGPCRRHWRAHGRMVGHISLPEPWAPGAGPWGVQRQDERELARP